MFRQLGVLRGQRVLPFFGMQGVSLPSGAADPLVGAERSRQGVLNKLCCMFDIAMGTGVPVRSDRSSDLSAVIVAIAGTCRHEADGIVGSHQHARFADLMRACVCVCTR